jgi:hypothetical protein
MCSIQMKSEKWNPLQTWHSASLPKKTQCLGLLFAGMREKSPRQGDRGSFKLFWLTSSSTQGKRYHLTFLSFSLWPINTKQPVNFNHALFQLISGSFTGPQLQLGRGRSVGSPVPPASERPGSTEPCRPNHDHYRSNRILAGAAQKALFTVITAPGPLSEQKRGAWG